MRVLLAAILLLPAPDVYARAILRTPVAVPSAPRVVLPVFSPHAVSLQTILTPSVMSPTLLPVTPALAVPRAAVQTAVPVSAQASQPVKTKSARMRAAAMTAHNAVKHSKSVQPGGTSADADIFFDGKGAARLPFSFRAVPEALFAEGAAPKLELPAGTEVEPILGVRRMVQEMRNPGKVLRARGIKATITVFGSARILPRAEAKAGLAKVLQHHGKRPETAAGKKELREARRKLKMSKYYEEARKFGALVAKHGGGKVAVVTGGGPGIMEAANRGAFEAGGPSIGYNIALPHEQDANPYLTPGLSFDFENFATRKMNLRQGAKGLVVFPGGFGTMDELFEIMTLIQTGKFAKVPIVLMGEKAYWNRILNFAAYDEMGMISPEDLKLFTFAETAGQAWETISQANTPAPRAH